MVKTIVYGKQGTIRKGFNVKVSSDILFSFDLSRSMNIVIKGLQATIKSFIKTLEGQTSGNIDWRIGFIGNKFVSKKNIELYKFDFTNRGDLFIKALESLKMGGDEISLPAIDWGLDFKWRTNAHKFLIHFTDEKVENGWDPKKSYEILPKLKKKIAELGVTLILVAPESKAFLELSSVDKCSYYILKNKKELEMSGFEKYMDKMGREVSTKSVGIVLKQKEVEKDIYHLNKYKNLYIYVYKEGTWFKQ